MERKKQKAVLSFVNFLHDREQFPLSLSAAFMIILQSSRAIAPALRIQLSPFDSTNTRSNKLIV
jgi:hypothetical protein